MLQKQELPPLKPTMSDLTERNPVEDLWYRSSQEEGNPFNFWKPMSWMTGIILDDKGVS